ncbi:hypothetical protein MES5069_1320015 [Mesorhizobium escarrei]|uniref:Uncharacterized protein n=1 Tax=Mesorhizobium escarrei TaxID=666018 RepID=A0ABN8JE88_9HYPH|nr:hypothetical protein MES5069_1320015 [Mesorhizobium escarrei]
MAFRLLLYECACVSEHAYIFYCATGKPSQVDCVLIFGEIHPPMEKLSPLDISEKAANQVNMRTVYVDFALAAIYLGYSQALSRCRHTP